MPSHRHQLVSKLSGNEVFTFLTENQAELHISAEDLKSYCGGDKGAPSIRPERGGHSIKISSFPNAEFDLRDGDSINGLQNGQNVNFSQSQIGGKGASGSFQSPDGKTITIIDGLITSIV